MIISVASQALSQRETRVAGLHPLAWGAILVLTFAASALAFSPIPMILAATAALFLLALRDLTSGVVAIVATVPVQSAAAFQVGTTSVTLTKLAVAATVVAWLMRVCQGASRPRLSAVTTVFGLHVLVLMASIVEAHDVSAWGGEVYRWAISLLVFVIAVESLQESNSVPAILAAVAGGVIALSVFGIWQVYSGAGPLSFAVSGVTRAYGTFGEPNPFAGYLEMTVLLLIPVALWGLIDSHACHQRLVLNRGSRVAVIVASIAGTIALAATQSRGGYLGFAVGLVIAVWMTGGKVRWMSTVGAGIAVAAVLASPLGGRLTDRLSTDAFTMGGGQVTSGNFAAQERAAHWRAAVNMAKSSPFLGVGAGNFNERFRDSTGVWRFRIPRGHAHNAYLQALAQSGIAGLVSYLALIAVVVGRIWRVARDRQAVVPRPIVIGVAAVTASVIVHNLVEYLHVLSLGLQLSVVWALLEAARGSGKSVPGWAVARRAGGG